MPWVSGWSENELERRAYGLAALIRRAWRAIARKLATTVEAQPIITMADAGQLVYDWQDAVENPIIGYITETYIDAANNIAVALDVPADEVIGEDLVDLHVNEARNRLKGIGNDVWEIVRDQIAVGQRQGESIKQIAARVRNVTGVSEGRSLTIARTEVHMAHEAASYAQAMFVDPNGTKEWLATNDTRTRETHRLADGQRVKINESFTVGASRLRYPGDPLGEPGETINCRCSTAYNFDMIIAMEPDEVKEPALVAASQQWKPHLHPRGNDGKFIEKGAVADFLKSEKPTIITTHKAVDELTSEQWNKLTDAQKQHISDSINKLPDGSQVKAAIVNKLAKIKTKVTSAKTVKPVKAEVPSAPKIPAGLKGKPGDPAKVTTTLIWGKHEPGTVILEDKWGLTRIVWDGKNYRTQVNEDGTWKTASVHTKKSAYETYKADTGWKVPGALTVPEPEPTPQLTLTSKQELPVAKTDIIESDWTKTQDFSGLTKVGGQQGSNLGGVFSVPDGTRYYIKKSKTQSHAANEIAASALYNLAGIDTPQVMKGEGAPDIGGGLQTGTKLVPGAKSDLHAKLKDPAYKKKVQEGFAIDAWLANWDVVGLGYDNIVTDENGKPHRIDVGGAMLYRAQGVPKGAEFGNVVNELNTLRDPAKNAQAAQVFGDMTDDDIRESVKRLEAISEADIDKIITESGLPSPVATTLKNRRTYILGKYGSQTVVPPSAPEPQQPPVPEVTPTKNFVSGGDLTLKELKTLVVDNRDNYANGEEIGASPDGYERILWDKLNYTYVQQYKQSDGTWSPGAKIENLTVISTLRLKNWNIPGELLTFTLPKPTASNDPYVLWTKGLITSQEYIDLTGHAPDVSAPATGIKTFTNDDWDKLDYLLDTNALKTHEVVAVSVDGQHQIVYSTFLNGFIIQVKQPDGSWSNEQTIGWDKRTLSPGKQLKTKAAFTQWVAPPAKPEVTAPPKPMPTPPAKLTYSQESVITNWSGVTSKQYKFGDVVALNVDGQHQILASWPGIFLIQQKQNNNWVTVESGIPNSELSYLTENDYVGPWIVPPPPSTAKKVGEWTQDQVDVELDKLYDDTLTLNEVKQLAHALTPDHWSNMGNLDKKKLYNALAEKSEVGDVEATDLMVKLKNLNHGVVPTGLVKKAAKKVAKKVAPSQQFVPTPIDKNEKIFYLEEAKNGTITQGEAIHLISGMSTNDMQTLTSKQIDSIDKQIAKAANNDVPGGSAMLTKWTNLLVDSSFGAPAPSTSTKAPIDWQGVDVDIDAGDYQIGEVVAVSADGTMQVIMYNGGNYGDLALQTYNPTTGDWQIEDIFTDSYSASAGEKIQNMMPDTVWHVPDVMTAPTPAPAITPPTPAVSAPTPTITAPTTDIDKIPPIVKKNFKTHMGDTKTGYWSKPEKIWDEIKKIQAQYPDPNTPGESKYSPLQIIKSLDAQLKTKESNPYETKMVKWATSAKGAAYTSQTGVMNISANVPTIDSADKIWANLPNLANDSVIVTGTNTIGDKFQLISKTSDDGKSAIMAQIKNEKTETFSSYAFIESAYVLNYWLTNPKYTWALPGATTTTLTKTTWKPASESFTGEGSMPGTAENVIKAAKQLTQGAVITTGVSKNGNKYRAIAWTTSSGDAAAKVEALNADGTWTSVGVYGNPIYIEHVKWDDIPPSTGVPLLENDDISGLSDAKQQNIYSAFKGQPGTYLSSSPPSVFDAAQSVKDVHGLSLGQVLNVVDAVGAKKANKPNEHLFKKKVADWLKTPTGAAYILNEPTGIPSGLPTPPKFSPGVDPDVQLPSLEESNKYAYNVVPDIYTATNIWNDITAKTSPLTPGQKSGLKTWTGGTYMSINPYLYEPGHTLSPTHKTAMNNAQAGMRPSDRPMLLHRGVNFDAIAGATNHAQLTKLVGQTLRNNAFSATSIGGKPAFAGKPVWIEVEAPPGTPMAWLQPFSNVSTENEMLIGANVHFKILDVEQKTISGHGIKSVVRVRIVPKPQETTI